MQQQNAQTNDLLISTRQTVAGPSRNDPKKHRTQLYLTAEQAFALAGEITRVAQANGDLGVKLDIYTSKKLNKNTNREFDSTFMFVKATQPASQDNGGGQGGGYQNRGNAPAQQTFRPAGVGSRVGGAQSSAAATSDPFHGMTPEQIAAVQAQVVKMAGKKKKKKSSLTKGKQVG